MQLLRFLLLIVFGSLLLPSAQATLTSISIITNDDNLKNSISKNSINDCLQLLRKACNCDVQLNNQEAQILIELPDIKRIEPQESRFLEGVTYPYLAYPNHDYSWYSQRIGERIVLQLQATTYQGISCGLYGLLQEQLWFSFYHPTETHIPELTYWPLTESFYWHARARFDKKGFHLHTMHPIELTEALLNPDFPAGQEKIRQYIDWLARNQQNYFEFNLLQTIDTARWGNYIRPIISYAHERGILIGIDISLNMKQQKAYKLYSGWGNMNKKKAQIRRQLDAICRNLAWDVVNIEFSSTEFSSGNVAKRQELQSFTHQLLDSIYHIKLMGRKHVVKSENMRAGKQKAAPLTPAQQALDQKRGVLIHTVMFYSLFDSVAPVYENKNFAHLAQLLQTQQTQRETWYYPESAYWITFDNSVPMLLLPYLSARLKDIEIADSLGVKGHVTFSSGWEWGYWLVDWSIARWSWRHEFNGSNIEPSPTQFLGDLFKRERSIRLFTQALALQDSMVKNKELIRYLCPASVTDELPKPFNMAFQPRPEKTMHWWRYKATADDIAQLQRKVIEPLRSFSRQLDEILGALSREEILIQDKQLRATMGELIRALKVMGLRAKHRSFTLEYLASKRLAKINHTDKRGNLILYTKAQKIREEALIYVNLQEFAYRYSVQDIARPLKGHTAYDFGYLYTVSNLQLWQREEEQYLNDKYSPFYRSVWDITKILGVDRSK
jgi:hypothetical protein